MIEYNKPYIMFVTRQLSKAQIYFYSDGYTAYKETTKASWERPETAIAVAPDQLGYWDDTDTDT